MSLFKIISPLLVLSSFTLHAAEFKKTYSFNDISVDLHASHIIPEIIYDCLSTKDMHIALLNFSLISKKSSAQVAIKLFLNRAIKDKNLNTKLVDKVSQQFDICHKHYVAKTLTKIFGIQFCDSWALNSQLKPLEEKDEEDILVNSMRESRDRYNPSLTPFLLKNNALNLYTEYQNYIPLDALLLGEIQNNNPDSINLLIKNGANVNNNHFLFPSPLVAAIFIVENLDIAKTLIEHKADVNVQPEVRLTDDKNITTLLRYADYLLKDARGDNRKYLKKATNFLLENGAKEIDVFNQIDISIHKETIDQIGEEPHYYAD